VGERPTAAPNAEKFAEMFGVTLKQLMAWEGDKAFMQSVLEHQGHWIAQRPRIMEALLARATNTEDKEQLLYASAYMIAIGDPTGQQLGKLAG